MENTRICKRCVMPESRPQIWLNKEGICNLCLEHEQAKKAQAERPLLETDFIKLLNKYKGKGKYDCLVMCSGGKDSTSALYYMKKRYHLNPLAFSFDHGFETKEAMANVRNAIDILGVDFLMYKSDYMREMFSRLLSSGSRAVLCHPCSIWYMGVAFEIAERFETPIIIAGWTKGQSTRQEVMSKCGCNINSPEFAGMAAETKAFLDEQKKTNLKYRDFPQSMGEVLERANKRHHAIVLSPHWFLPFDTEHNLKLIKKELGWKATKTSYPKGTTNCLLNFISVYNSMRHYGYTHYHVEMSKLIRENHLTREEALESLRLDFDKSFLNRIAKKLDYRFD